MSTEPSISEEAILRATGRSWREWFGVLGVPELRDLSHKEIVAYLREKHGVPAWWQRSIAGEFEKFIGRGGEAEAEGDFQISVSHVLDMPVAKVRSAWIDESIRAKWLRAADFVPDTLAAPDAIRGKWATDGSRIDVVVESLSDGRCRMDVRHHKLRDAQLAEAMKKFWIKALDRIAVKVS